MKDKFVNYWAVTGTFHGSIVSAGTEGDAKRAFHKAWGGESIIYIKRLTNLQASLL